MGFLLVLLVIELVGAVLFYVIERSIQYQHHSTDELDRVLEALAWPLILMAFIWMLIRSRFS